MPEVRFLLASALKKIGRNQESMKQVLLLLQSQQENVRNNPKPGLTGSEGPARRSPNQLYKEGDYVNALEIYLSLADLDKSPAWQLPVWYQTALIYEQLQQWQKAHRNLSTHHGPPERIDRDRTPRPVCFLCLTWPQWRKDYIAWMQKAKVDEPGVSAPDPPLRAPPAGRRFR